MADELYNNDFLKETLQVILDNLRDLELWSVHNGDKWLGLIIKMKSAVEFIQKGKI